MRHDDRHPAAPPSAPAPPTRRVRDASGTSEAAAWWRQLRGCRWLGAIAVLVSLALVAVALLRWSGA
ncbi:hypothetical protein DYQ93_12975 [Xanthomonas sp. LMG 8992]|uniref:hypothetical protein n=1 Tax=Xanthomonas sp. LMG 8992 TaxID=1591157 RepID=UPI0013707619|nr:hypothetical protein [Xanthomonas sp. LMG 8992]MXV11935.1 hypothetical protein [Xanthomonas sp. LMG 8992]